MKRRYRYRCVDREGRPLTGEVAADSPEEAAAHASRWGTVEDVVEIGAPVAQLSKDESLELAEFLAETMSSRLPIPDALRALAYDQPRHWIGSRTESRLSELLKALAAALERGMTLPEACLHVGMPPDIASLLEVGSEYGQPETVLHEYCQQLRYMSLERRRLTLSLAYPFGLLVTGLFVAGAITVGIVPSFKKIFEDFGTELPSLTRLVVGISDLLQNVGGIYFLFGLLITAALLLIFSSRLLSIPAISRIATRLPAVGNIVHSFALSGFCRVLAICAKSRGKLPESLTTAAITSGDADIQAATVEILDRVDEGETLITAASGQRTIPRAIFRVIARTRNPQTRAEALRAMGDWYALRAERRGLFIAVLLEPVIILTVGFGVGMIVFGMFMPLIKLLNDLS